MNKGFIDIGILAIASTLLVGVVFVGALLNERVQTQELKERVAFLEFENSLGVSITTTTLSNTINEFRTQSNANFEALNTELSAVTSTIGTYGTIVTENSPLQRSAGGTGTSTTPSNNQFFGASSSIPTWKSFISGIGITVSSSPTSTWFNTTGVDQTATFGWTGPHTWSATTTVNGNNTINGTTTIQTGELRISASTSFSGTVSGLSFNQLIDSTSTNVENLGSSATTTLLSVTIPANTLVGRNAIEAEVFFGGGNGTTGRIDTNASTDVIEFQVSYGGTKFATVNITGFNASVLGYMKIYLAAANSSNAQEGMMALWVGNSGSATGTFSLTGSEVGGIALGQDSTQPTISATSSQTLLLTAKNNFAVADNGVVRSAYIVRKIINQ